MRIDDVRRLDLGTFVRPAEETGTGQPRIEVVYAYVVSTPHGVLLLDTGLGEADEETERW
jgi:N-acyl homoserine lactone hydrolase